MRTLVEMGRLVTGADYLKAEQFRYALMRDYARLFETADVVIGPTEPVTALRIGEATVQVSAEAESALAATWRLTYPYQPHGLACRHAALRLRRRGIADRLADRGPTVRGSNNPPGGARL